MRVGGAQQQPLGLEEKLRVPTGVVRLCQCVRCQLPAPHLDREYHRQMNLLLSRLDEQQRRWYLAVESQRLVHAADRLLLEITGVDQKTIRPGREEMAASVAEQPTDRVRQTGAGRRPAG